MRFSKIIVFVMACCFYLSCNDNTQQVANTPTQDQNNAPSITAKDIEDLSYTEYALSDASDTHTANWLKFQELQQHILSLKKGDTLTDSMLSKTFKVSSIWFCKFLSLSMSNI